MRDVEPLRPVEPRSPGVQANDRAGVGKVHVVRAQSTLAQCNVRARDTRRLAGERYTDRPLTP